MMYYDHAMLGAALAIAAGGQRRHGWPLVGMAGVAAMLPDWDGLSELVGPVFYREVHRVWGHNLWAAVLAGGLFAAVCYLVRSSLPQPGRAFSGHALAVWIAVGILAVFSHVLADVIFSAGGNEPDWPVALLWPFDQRRWAWSVMPWSDWRVTLLLLGGTTAIGLRSRNARSIACLTLVAVFGYISVRAAF